MPDAIFRFLNITDCFFILTLFEWVNAAKIAQAPKQHQKKVQQYGIVWVVRHCRTTETALSNYPFVTIPLYIPRSLGLNMIEPHKPLIDSGLAVHFIFDSTKVAPKVRKMPRFPPGQVKIKLLK